MDKYCETKLIFKMDIYFETEGVLPLSLNMEAFCKNYGD